MVEYIEFQKVSKPSTTAVELQAGLLQVHTLNYIMQMSELEPTKVHFFDECSVKTTTGNRTYGHSLKGKPGIEVKRFTSHCNYTVNLLQSVFCITNFGVIEGPSTGLEMLEFLKLCISLIRSVIQFSQTVTMLLWITVGSIMDVLPSQN